MAYQITPFSMTLSDLQRTKSMFDTKLMCNIRKLFRRYYWSISRWFVLLSYNKNLSFRRGTVRRTMSVEVLSTAAQLYERITFSKA